MEIDHEIISKVILLLPLIQEGLLSITSEGICMKYQGRRRRTTFFAEYAFRRVPFFSFRLILLCVMQLSITLVALVINRPA